ncbi:MAG: hypothetical protein M1840_004265 [Geoglossum simile]|nr:MAG: hypothetical protein M1840_004265 [Geoglossum simile]
MKVTLSVLLGLTAVQGALGSVLERRACNADNCARAVTGTRAGAIPLATRLADCASFFQVTVTPANVTQVVTVTAGAAAKRHVGVKVRQVTAVPTDVPTYATACSGIVRYSSACSCAGITKATVTVSAPVATVTVVAQPPCNGTDFLTDPNNCGACGNVCPSGKCTNGACSSNTCTGQTCDNFGLCGAGGSCVCATTADNTGFCVDGSTSCGGLASCTLNSDCATGEICAVGTCCGGNVCVGATFCGTGTTKRSSFPPLKRGPAMKRGGHTSAGTIAGVPPPY